MGISIETLCEKSTNLKDKNDPNKMCQETYLVQSVATSYSPHERSQYWKNLLELEPVAMARSMVSQVSDMHVKVRGELSNGRFDWFKPIYNSNICEYMIKANKELQEVIDNGNLLRGQTTKKMLKEGRIFTYQANEVVKYQIDNEHSVLENIDQKGVPFVEYSYNQEVSEDLWTKSTTNKHRTYTKEDYDKYINSPNLMIRDTFHLIIMGLDRINLTVKELHQEIYIKIRTLVGTIMPENIMVIDNDSLVGKTFNPFLNNI